MTCQYRWMGNVDVSGWVDGRREWRVSVGGWGMWMTCQGGWIGAVEDVSS